MCRFVSLSDLDPKVVAEIPPSPHHRYNTNSVGIIHTLSRGGGRGGVADEGLVSDYGIGHG